ncbi:hypothetical protein EYF80_019011 [Liparis tanakae]|uniref:Uncharacterized protein n=1 Tax=Liparis tanakae TaxID=230148 RepID=A0A4Z2HYI9_9TELE|nr:hypothetical protein EYF80_019011 [Liparis tanakae]
MFSALQSSWAVTVSMPGAGRLVRGNKRFCCNSVYDRFSHSVATSPKSFRRVHKMNLVSGERYLVEVLTPTNSGEDSRGKSFGKPRARGTVFTIQADPRTSRDTTLTALSILTLGIKADDRDYKRANLRVLKLKSLCGFTSASTIITQNITVTTATTVVLMAARRNIAEDRAGKQTNKKCKKQCEKVLIRGMRDSGTRDTARDAGPVRKMKQKRQRMERIKQRCRLEGFGAPRTQRERNEGRGTKEEV